MTDPTPQTPLESHLPESDNIDPNEALASSSTPSRQPGTNPSGSTPPHYEAKCYSTEDFDVVSYDPHLNTDGEALYHCLLSKATSSPTLRISCRATRTEEQERAYKTVTDFDFCIDIALDGPIQIQWSVADDEPAYRGRMEREFEGSSGTGRQVAKKKEIKLHDEWDETVWVYRLGSSSKSLRQWADEYCASPKKKKEFVYKKVLYGWNMQQIDGAIRSTIKPSPFNEFFNIDYKTYGSKIYIRPEEFSVKGLVKYFRSSDVGRWEVCGGAYPLKQWVPTSKSAETSTRYRQTPTGPKELFGVKEGEWLKKWESVIIRAVRDRYRSPIPLNKGFNGFTDSAVMASDLDGY